jgi:hypothetical protein
MKAYSEITPAETRADLSNHIKVYFLDPYDQELQLRVYGTNPLEIKPMEIIRPDLDLTDIHSISDAAAMIWKTILFTQTRIEERENFINNARELVKGAFVNIPHRARYDSLIRRHNQLYLADSAGSLSFPQRKISGDDDIAIFIHGNTQSPGAFTNMLKQAESFGLRTFVPDYGFSAGLQNCVDDLERIFEFAYKKSARVALIYGHSRGAENVLLAVHKNKELQKRINEYKTVLELVSGGFGGMEFETSLKRVLALAGVVPDIDKHFTCSAGEKHLLAMTEAAAYLPENIRERTFCVGGTRDMLTSQKEFISPCLDNIVVLKNINHMGTSGIDRRVNHALLSLGICCN